MLYPITHLNAIGLALFSQYKAAFLLAGFILTIAMIGAIVITIEDGMFKTVKQQYPYKQSLRNSENTIYLLDFK